jgi:hypothetical protein
LIYLPTGDRNADGSSTPDGRFDAEIARYTRAVYVVHQSHIYPTIVTGALIAFRQIFAFLPMTSSGVQPRWLEIATRKRELQQAALISFVESHPIPAASTLRDLLVDVNEASKAVVDGSVSCVDLVTAYCHQ